MNSQPEITTIIPTYRRPRLLRRAIASALEQEGASLVVSVFDNASNDETGEMVTALAATDPRVRYHCHEANIGGAANFEFGLRRVVTPFFSILSDDDYLLPGFYRKAMDDLAACPEAMFWVGMTLNVDEDHTIWDARVDRWPREGFYASREGTLAMMHGMAPTWIGIVFRAQILDRIGLPDQQVLGPSDLDFTLRAAASCPFILRKHPSAVFTLNAASFSATQPLSSFWPGWRKMFLNIEASRELDCDAKVMVLRALHEDARRMLFRRGANALAQARCDFARDAATVLREAYGKSGRALLLEALGYACGRLPWVQRLYTLAYRAAERRLIDARGELESRFGHLVRRAND